MTPASRSTIRTVVGVLFLLPLTAAACNGGDDPSTVTPTTAAPAAAVASTAPAPTITAEGQRLLDDPDAVIPAVARGILRPDELEVARAYVRAEQSQIAAGMSPQNPDDPRVLATAGGEFLEGVRKSVRELQQAGVANQAPKVLFLIPKRLDIHGSGAGILVCLAQRVPLYKIASGDVYDDQEFTVMSSADLEQHDGRWQVVRREQVGEVQDGNKCFA
jgi:hypothetical protein